MEKATKTPHCSETLLKSILGSLNEQNEFRKCPGASVYPVGLSLTEAEIGQIELDPMFPMGHEVVEGSLEDARRCIEYIMQHCSEFRSCFKVDHHHGKTAIYPDPEKKTIIPVDMQFICDTAIAV